MHKSTTSKIIFLSIIFIIGFIAVNIHRVSGSVSYNPIVEANWLYVKAGAFVDTSPDPLENDIYIATGGEDLLSFENLGIISSSDESILYGSKVVFGYETSAHTGAGVNDVFPNLNTQNKYKIGFLWISHVDAGGTCYRTDVYDAEWTDVSLGASVRHDYSGHIPMTVGIKPLTITSGNMILNEIEFPIPEYKFNVLQSEVELYREGECGEYTDEFIVDNDEVSVVFVDEEGYSDQASSVITEINKHDIGVKQDPEIKLAGTIYQSISDGSQPGATFHNADPTDDEYYTFQLGCRLAPEVRYYNQKIYRTYLSLGLHYPIFRDMEIRKTAGPSTIEHTRITGAHVYNQFIHWDMTVTVYFYATVESTAELTQSILSDPVLKMGDWVWDPEFVGKDITVSIYTKTLLDMIWEFIWAFLGPIITILIVGIALYIFIKVGVPYLSRKAKGKSKK